MNGRVIKPASVGDLAAICNIEDDSFPSPYPRFLLQHLLQDHSDTFYVVTNNNGEVVGYCVCSVNGKSAHLISIATHREFRRKGFATALLERLVNHLTEKGVAEIHLEVSVKNSEAIRLYSKTGFEKLSITPNYYSDGSDALMMRLMIRDDLFGQSRDSD